MGEPALVVDDAADPVLLFLHLLGKGGLVFEGTEVVELLEEGELGLERDLGEAEDLLFLFVGRDGGPGLLEIARVVLPVEDGAHGQVLAGGPDAHAADRLALAPDDHAAEVVVGDVEELVWRVRPRPVLDGVHLEELDAAAGAEQQCLLARGVRLVGDLADHRPVARADGDDALDVAVVHRHVVDGEVVQGLLPLLHPGGAARVGRDLDDVDVLAARLEGERDHRRPSLSPLLTDEVEEVDVGGVGHAVQPVDDHLGHPREQLDQGHARIGISQVRPLGTVLGDEVARLSDDVVVAAVV